ncbi:MAG: hypothetical protein KJ592_01860 [Nanoarchaeota archaeon]|nr:hypothetical protein [Nanoarchaeota archaeon]
MSSRIISSLDQDLASMTRYVSPTYTAEFDKIVEASDDDRPDRILFKDVQEDNIHNWLEANSLCRVHYASFPSEIDHDMKYLFASNGGLHLINESFTDVKYIAPLFRSNQNRVYERRLTIRSQPSGILLPKGLVSALDERGFREVEEFENYRD